MKAFVKDKELARELGAKGGRNSSGYVFAHGKVDPKVVGKLGGRPRGVLILKPGEKNPNVKRCDMCKKTKDGSVRCTRPGPSYFARYQAHKIKKGRVYKRGYHRTAAAS